MTKKEDAQIIVKSDMGNMLSEARRAAKGGPAPVHLWSPPFCGDLDMVIKRDGTWFHEGSPIGRPAMVRLFSSILKREGDAYFLVTPVEKVGITVEDAPFVAVDIAAEGSGADQQILFTTHVGEQALLDPAHPLRVVFSADGEPAPYVMVRAGLEARIDRKSFYRLVDLAVEATHEGAPWLGVYSGGTFFPVIEMGALG